jgi:hypothetical protein
LRGGRRGDALSREKEAPAFQGARFFCVVA